MSLTPRQLDLFTSPLIEIYNAMESELLQNIASKLQTDEEETSETILSWQFQKLNQLQALTKENIEVLSERTGIAEETIYSILENAGFTGIAEQESFLQRVAKGGNLKQAPPVKEDPTIIDTLNTYYQQAKTKLNLTNSTILIQSQQVYRDIVNKTTAEVLSGLKTHQEALRSACIEYSKQGIPAFISRTGRKWSTEAHVGTVIRTVSNNVTNQMQEDRCASYGIDLVEISSHSGARPKCARYQGKVFSLSGNHPRYPPLSSTSYGEPDGLFGINCGHQKYAYIEGVSIRRNKPYNQRENAKAYEQSQKQRYIERQIRKAKNEANMLRAIGDEEGAAKAELKIRKRQAAMRAFIEETGRERRRYREQVY
ncbi:phage minor capsid protein [Bacillus subtilis]|nr:phage minor capsid protein [Bacillus subtilis]KIN39944.1 hypothetical protein B4070_4355 [Bacillus subtilis]KMN94577.1 hypothetical protein VL08_13115 [Bacillus subtilis]MCB4338646.1 hypothetical protein [Bacillus subtilis]MCM3060586.1 phage minor capsid protein [Bacillus subtilis]MDI6580854.1 phage minor capsid protein [Bacillus subtilis]